jgi:hypothetical protein
MDLKKNQADFLPINTFPPKQTPFLLDLSVLCLLPLIRLKLQILSLLLSDRMSPICQREISNIRSTDCQQ